MDGQTDMTKLIFALRNFVNMPKNILFPHAALTVSFYNRDEECFLHGTDYIFK
jgi:hypothetical protein